MYIAGRIVDATKPLHSGNVEYIGGYETDRNIAQKRADDLNAAEGIA